MNIEIISDTICPWCFIGKRRFEKALKQRPELDVNVSWRAFFLNPDMPAEGMERKDYVERKFGGKERAQAIYDRISEAGAGENITFRFDLIKRTPNTTDSHRLIHFAEQKGCQDAVVEILFRRYFLEGQNIGDTAVLSDAALEAGINRDEATQYLEGDADREKIKAAYIRANSLGVTGVPFFIFDNRYAISGAQPPEVFLQVFDRLQEEQTEPTAK